MNEWKPGEAKDAERVAAFELYISANLEGKRRSVRSIAQELGISQQTIFRWKKEDDWDVKVNATLSKAAQSAETLSNEVKRRVRLGLLDGLDSLRKIAVSADRDADKVAAVVALAKISTMVEAITQGASGSGEVSQVLPDFKDDIEKCPAPMSIPTTTSPPSLEDLGLEESLLTTKEIPL